MAVTAIGVRVDNVADAVDFLHRAYGWAITSDDPHSGEVQAGDLRIVLSSRAMVPWGQVGGLILHEYVEDVPAAVERAVSAGAELLLGPVETDWGTEAAYLKGPGNLVVDVCREAIPAW